MSDSRSTVTLHMVASLDGYIEARGGDMAWFQTVDRYENGADEPNVEEFLKTIDCYVMGARTYELAMKLGWVYGDTPTVVLTHRALSKARPTVELYTGELAALIEGLRRRYRSVWVVGGAAVVQACLRERLADDLRLTIVPILLGDGVPLFARGAEQPLHLKGTTAYKSGFVELWYALRRSVS